MYAVRRIKDGFRMHKSESDQASVEQLIHEAEWNYQVIQRQVNSQILYVEIHRNTGRAKKMSTMILYAHKFIKY